jgi:hypothetical protein
MKEEKKDQAKRLKLEGERKRERQVETAEYSG